MPAAADKGALRSITCKEFGKFDALLDSVPSDLSLIPDAEDTSIRDIVAHRAHWIDLFLGWWRDGQAGRDVAFPAPGYKWSDLRRYNADLRVRQAGLGWTEARACLADRHAALLAFINTRTEAELYGGPMKGGRNAWTTGRWAEAAGASHYRSAAKYVRARLRVASAG